MTEQSAPQVSTRPLGVAIISAIFSVMLSLYGASHIHWLSPLVILAFAGVSVWGARKHKLLGNFDLASYMTYLGVAWALGPLFLVVVALSAVFT